MIELTVRQRIEFLEMYARMAPKVEFERRLGLMPADIQEYCNLLDVQSENEARTLAKRMRAQNDEASEAIIVEQTKRVREAEAVAQQRLDELEAKRNAERPVREVDANKIRQEDADRQRRWAESQAKTTVPTKTWRLPVDGTEAQRAEQIDSFRREIIYRGYAFLQKKYGATKSQVRHEADRLGLSINWDVVRR